MAKLEIVSWEIEETFVTNDLDSVVVVKLNLSNGETQKIAWTDDYTPDDCIYAGPCYSCYERALLGCEWLDWCDDEGEWLDPEEMSHDDIKAHLEEDLCFADDYVPYLLDDDYKANKWWDEIREIHGDDDVNKVEVGDAYVGDIWGDEEFGMDRKKYEECPKYKVCKVKIKLNDFYNVSINLELNKEFILDVDSGNSYSGKVESYYFESLIKKELMGKTVNEAKEYCERGVITIDEY